MNTQSVDAHQTASERGLLDLSVEVSTNNVTAGKEFALFVLIKNPFSRPIWIRDVNVSLPSELRLVEDEVARKGLERTQETHAANLEAAERGRAALLDRLSSVESKLHEAKQLNGVGDADRLNALVHRLETDLHALHEQAQHSIAGRAELRISGADVDTIEIGSQHTDLRVSGEEGRRAKIGVIKVSEPWLVLQQAAQARTVNLKGSLPQNVALQPGSTAVFTAVIAVKRSLVFTPSQYRLQFFVNFAFDAHCAEETGRLGRDAPAVVLANTVAHQLAIRPSVYSILIGATLGGGVGAVAQLLQGASSSKWEEWPVTIMIAVILSAVAVIFMARKSDAQSFVSVEDFWGGILIGFLVGYTGTAFFEDLTGIVPASRG